MTKLIQKANPGHPGLCFLQESYDSVLHPCSAYVAPGLGSFQQQLGVQEARHRGEIRVKANGPGPQSGA